MRRYDSRESRFSNRVLLNYAAANLPEALSVRAAAGDNPAEILLYDEIGFWGVTAKEFVLALAAAGDGPLTLRINSPGGDVFDGLAIYNALRARTAPVNVVIDGLAASAASFIAMAGDTLTMAEQSMLMIHKAWGMVIGNEDDMLETALVLGKIDGQLAQIYANKSGKPLADMLAVMKAETYYTSAEAKEVGLCDVVATGEKQTEEARANAKAATAIPVAARLMAKLKPSAAALPAYDPDGDGDNDAQEALTLMQAACDMLDQACDALTGEDDEDGDDEADTMPIVPGASGNQTVAAAEAAARRAKRKQKRAAATTPEWVAHADENLPIDNKATWDGPAAAERMLDAAGFNGNSPDPTKARRGFLVYDRANPKLKGSYKLPFADLIGGELKAVKGGLDAAASRLPQTDIPDDVKAKARATLDVYEKKMGDAANDKAKAEVEQRRRRLRLAEAEAA